MSGTMVGRGDQCDAWIGKTIPQTDLVIKECLGTTSVGEVFKARSSQLGRQYRVRFVERSTERKWRKEVEALAQIRNPHVVHLFRVIDLPSHVVVITNWVDGPSLKAEVSRQPLPPAQVIRLAEQLAQGLYEPHQAGLFHGALDPTCIALEVLPNGEFFAKLLDFGIARRTDDGRQTIFSTTSDFAAPEQLSGGQIDARSDIYALGCNLYYALTGRAPFPGSRPVDVANGHLYRPAPAPSALVPALSHWNLDEVLERMLAKNPDDRIQDCQQLLAALAMADASPGATTQPGEPKPAEEAVRITCVGPDQSVVTASKSHIILKRNGSASFYGVSLGDERITAIHALDREVVFGTSGGRLAQLSVREGTTETIVKLPGAREVVGVSSTRNQLLAAIECGSLFVITRDGNYGRLDCSPTERKMRPTHLDGAADSNVFAVARADGSLTIFEATPSLTIRQVRTVRPPFEIEQIAVSPDGYVVAVMGGHKTTLFNALNGETLHEVSNNPRTRPEAVLFSGGTLMGLAAEGNEMFPIW